MSKYENVFIFDSWNGSSLTPTERGSCISLPSSSYPTGLLMFPNNLMSAEFLIVSAVEKRKIIVTDKEMLTHACDFRKLFRFLWCLELHFLFFG